VKIYFNIINFAKLILVKSELYLLGKKTQFLC
jgi:hypothetical protein